MKRKTNEGVCGRSREGRGLKLGGGVKKGLDVSPTSLEEKSRKRKKMLCENLQRV